MTENTLSSTPSINQSHEVTSFHLRIFFSYNFQIINFSVTTVLLFFKSLLNHPIYLEFNTFHPFIKCPYSEFLWSLISRIPTGWSYFSANLPVQSKCWKIRNRKSPNTNTFSAVAVHLEILKTFTT